VQKDDVIKEFREGIAKARDVNSDFELSIIKDKEFVYGCSQSPGDVVS